MTYLPTALLLHCLISPKDCFPQIWDRSEPFFLKFNLWMTFDLYTNLGLIWLLRCILASLRLIETFFLNWTLDDPCPFDPLKLKANWRYFRIWPQNERWPYVHINMIKVICIALAFKFDLYTTFTLYKYWKSNVQCLIFG